MNSKIEFVNDLNNRFFEGRLSKQFLEQLEKLPIDRPDVLAFVKRMFGFINQAGMPPEDMSILLGEILGTLLARILPGAWEGRVPPITVSGRHAVIDQYIKSNQWTDSANKTMVDIGCGFPPYTTLETANYLPDWNITGVDPSLPVYLAYDADENYATFDENKSVVYFQPAVPTVENWNELLNDAAATKIRFEKLLEELLIKPNHENDSFPRLEYDPIKNYQTGNLSFIQGGIGQIEIEPKDVIRCFNVLYYFNDDFFKHALTWFAKNTKEGGVVFIGGDWAVSTECYYNVYQKYGDHLVNREFAFSIDCICPIGIVTWYANHDDDRQTAELIRCIAVIRKNKSFMDDFYSFHDSQREKYKLCPRNKQGYYGGIDPSIGPAELWTRASAILNELNDAGFNQKAVEVLVNSGINARVNEVGHVAIIL